MSVFGVNSPDEYIILKVTQDTSVYEAISQVRRSSETVRKECNSPTDCFRLPGLKISMHILLIFYMHQIAIFLNFIEFVIHNIKRVFILYGKKCFNMRIIL